MSANPVTRILAFPLRLLVLVYRYGVSPFTPGSCRFHPTCSQYAEDALRTHGAVKGLYLSARRICRCHPWGGSGYDPVPPATTNTPFSPEGSTERQ